jgi:hypothetical protein
MLILWIRRRKPKESEEPAPEAESFPEHDEKMKRFRVEHRGLETERPRDILTPDGHVLAPAEGVKLPDNSNN